jgi:hypothetical protein
MVGVSPGALQPAKLQAPFQSALDCGSASYRHSELAVVSVVFALPRAGGAAPKAAARRRGDPALQSSL